MPQNETTPQHYFLSPLERNLLHRAQNGDQEAFGKLIEKPYRQHLSNFCLRLGYNAQDAEDFVQETFTKAFQHIGKFKGDAKLSTWLFKILLNLITDEGRKRKTREGIATESLEEGRWLGDESSSATRDVPDASLSPHEVLELKEMLNIFYSVLSDEERIIWLMYLEKEMDVEEIADLMGKSCKRIYQILNTKSTKLSRIAKAQAKVIAFLGLDAGISRVSKNLKHEDEKSDIGQ